jgi:hypothetical protein
MLSVKRKREKRKKKGKKKEKEGAPCNKSKGLFFNGFLFFSFLSHKL